VSISRSTPRPSVLGIFPHPDDEAYAAGAALAQCAAAGVRVGVLTASRGEAGVDRSAARNEAGDVGARREQELRRACAVLGVECVGILGFPDGRIADISAEEAVATLARHLRAWSPTVVLTLGDDGVYGSRDHRALGRFVGEALRGFPAVCRLACGFPRGHFDRLRRRLRRSRLDLIDYAGPLGVSREKVGLRVPTGPARRVKLEAIACHASQLRNGDPATLLGPGMLEALLDEEWYCPA